MAIQLDRNIMTYQDLGYRHVVVNGPNMSKFIAKADVTATNLSKAEVCYTNVLHTVAKVEFLKTCHQSVFRFSVTTQRIISQISFHTFKDQIIHVVLL